MVTIQIELKSCNTDEIESWIQDNNIGAQLTGTYKQFGITYANYKLFLEDDASYFKIRWG